MNPFTALRVRASAHGALLALAGLLFALLLAPVLALAQATQEAVPDASQQAVIAGWRATLEQTEAALTRPGLTLCGQSCYTRRAA